MAMAGAALLILLDNVGRSAEQQSQNVHAALSEAEWVTLMFFLGLFILVHGVVKVGLIDMAAKGLLDVTGATSASRRWSSCGRRQSCRHSSTTSPSWPR
jgi:Na+/H+ antiporter NhaD/arsenite permease-like protein